MSSSAFRLVVSLILAWSGVRAADRPRLVFTAKECATIRAGLGSVLLFNNVYREAKAKVDRALAAPIEVPVPKDAGGYTHERHKQNYTEMYLAGIIYAVTKEEQYARFIRDMLKQYALLYPTLGDHPAKAGESSGRLFWQTLNETVWLVHTAQAYDFIHDWLKPEERVLFEKNIFRPMTRFFTIDHAAEHDRIHNHGTWTVTAVGMAGYAMRDNDLVDMALYGTKKNRTGGFLSQIDQLFSPDGFYTEGAYYFRYAIMPFMVFAQAIENNQPELKIFEYRNQILKKALYAGLQQTNMNGEFFPINDALKEKSFRSPEVVLAVDIVYQRYGQDPSLLWIADKQGTVSLLGAGLTVARSLARTKHLQAFPYRSIELSDGVNGDEGGIGILRAGPVDDQLVVAMKYTGHGLSHGHYDKLSILGYDAGREILQDYGAVRFLNVESKHGGRYLPETKAFAMQTVAHNTVTVDEQSQYHGSISISEHRHADRHFFSVNDPAVQAVSAKCDNAYDGVGLQRTLVMVDDPKNKKPVVIDFLRAVSSEEHRYDLPFYYIGHLMSTNVKYEYAGPSFKPLSAKSGFQYLWQEAEGRAGESAAFTWLQGNRYYTVTNAADSATAVVFVRIGANDSNFNLRHEAGVMLRGKGKEKIFASVLEPHGLWDGNTEVSREAYGNVASVSVLGANASGAVCRITWKDGRIWNVMISTGASSETAMHSVPTPGATFTWTGNVKLEKR